MARPCTQRRQQHQKPLKRKAMKIIEYLHKRGIVATITLTDMCGTPVYALSTIKNGKPAYFTSLKNAKREAEEFVANL